MISQFWNTRFVDGPFQLFGSWTMQAGHIMIILTAFLRTFYLSLKCFWWDLLFWFVVILVAAISVLFFVWHNFFLWFLCIQLLRWFPFSAKRNVKAFIFHSFFWNSENMYKQYGGPCFTFATFCLTSAKSGLI